MPESESPWPDGGVDKEAICRVLLPVLLSSLDAVTLLSLSWSAIYLFSFPVPPHLLLVNT
jgi:hypothetical protein